MQMDSKQDQIFVAFYLQESNYSLTISQFTTLFSLTENISFSFHLPVICFPSAPPSDSPEHLHLLLFLLWDRFSRSPFRRVATQSRSVALVCWAEIRAAGHRRRRVPLGSGSLRRVFCPCVLECVAAGSLKSHHWQSPSRGEKKKRCCDDVTRRTLIRKMSCLGKKNAPRDFFTCLLLLLLCFCREQTSAHTLDWAWLLPCGV